MGKLNQRVTISCLLIMDSLLWVVYPISTVMMMCIYLKSIHKERLFGIKHMVQVITKLDTQSNSLMMGAILLLVILVMVIQ